MTDERGPVTDEADEADDRLPGLDEGRAAAWMPFLLAAVVLAVAFAWGGRVYDDLPGSIATHWGPGGVADAWDEKSFGTVFMGPLMAAGTVAMMAFMAMLLPALMQPARNPSDWVRFRQEGVRRATVSVLGWVSLLTALLVGYLSVQGWETPEHVSLRWSFALYMVGIVALVFLPFRRWGRWSARRAEEAGVGPSPEEAAEERRWLPGGIHNDPDEPRVMVPKREGHGVGLTLNVGNRRGRTIAAAFLLVFIVLPTVLIFLAA